MCDQKICPLLDCELDHGRRCIHRKAYRIDILIVTTDLQSGIIPGNSKLRRAELLQLCDHFFESHDFLHGLSYAVRAA